MATTNYFTLNGQILAEEQLNGYGRRNYGIDGLGSVAATYDSTGASQNRFWYTPNGNILASTGTGSTPSMSWCGSAGYYSIGLAFSYKYVRARHYDYNGASWTSVDPLWPQMPAYLYVEGSPVNHLDPSGKGRVIDATVGLSAESNCHSKCVFCECYIDNLGYDFKMTFQPQGCVGCVVYQWVTSGKGQPWKKDSDCGWPYPWAQPCTRKDPNCQFSDTPGPGVGKQGFGCNRYDYQCSFVTCVECLSCPSGPKCWCMYWWIDSDLACSSDVDHCTCSGDCQTPAGAVWQYPAGTCSKNISALPQ